MLVPSPTNSHGSFASVERVTAEAEALPSVSGPSNAWMTCTGTLLFRCSDAKTRRQSCGKSTSGRPSARRVPAATETARNRPRIVWMPSGTSLLQENDYLVLRFLAEDVGKELDLALDAICGCLGTPRYNLQATGIAGESASCGSG